MIIDPIDQSIIMVSGDTERFDLDFVSGVEGVKFVTGDKMYLSVKKQRTDTDYLFQVTASLAPIQQQLVINPEHTKDLDEGVYWYDIQMNTAALGVKTIVWPTTFEIVRGVTHD